MSKYARFEDEDSGGNIAGVEDTNEPLLGAQNRLQSASPKTPSVPVSTIVHGGPSRLPLLDLYGRPMPSMTSPMTWSIQPEDLFKASALSPQPTAHYAPVPVTDLGMPSAPPMQLFDDREQLHEQVYGKSSLFGAALKQPQQQQQQEHPSVMMEMSMAPTLQGMQMPTQSSVNSNFTARSQMTVRATPVPKKKTPLSHYVAMDDLSPTQIMTVDTSQQQSEIAPLSSSKLWQATSQVFQAIGRVMPGQKHNPPGKGYHALQDLESPTDLDLPAFNANATTVTATVPMPVPSSSKARPTASPEEPTHTPYVAPPRTWTDLPFAFLYLVVFISFFVIGIIYTFREPPARLDDSILRQSAFGAFNNTTGLFFLSLTISTILGATWIALLRRYAEWAVWGTIVALPFATTGTFLYTLISAVQGHDAAIETQNNGLILVSIVTLLVGMIFVGLAYKNRERISVTIGIIKVACQILQEHPAMLLASLFLTLIYLVFVGIWSYFLRRLLLNGHLVLPNAPGESLKFELNDDAYWLLTYFILILLWTSSLFRHLQRTCMANVVGDWYFHRHEPFAPSAWDRVKNGLIHASILHFGSVAYGSLVLSSIRFLKWLLRAIHKRVSNAQSDVTVLRMTLTALTVSTAFLQRLLEPWTHYAMCYVGVEGVAFSTAAIKTFQLFRRHFLFTLTNDLIIRLILNTMTFTLSVACGAGTMLFATHVLGSPYGWWSGLLLTVLTRATLGFYTHLLLDTLDATLLCYALDVEQGRVHARLVHQAFTAKFMALRQTTASQ